MHRYFLSFTGSDHADSPPAPTPLDDRWRRIGAAVAVVVVVGAGIGWIALARADRPWGMIDLAVYRWGGEQVRVGGDLYGPGWPGTDLAGYHGGGLPFTYPPAAALAFVPASLVPTAGLQPLVTLLDVGLLLAIVLRCLRSLGYRRAPTTFGFAVVVAAACLLLEPVTQTIFFGQVNLVLVALVVFDVLGDDRRRTGGIGVGLAAGLKLTPAIFVLLFLVTGRRSAAGRAVATFAATVALGWLLLPSASSRYWTGGLFRDASRIGDPSFVGNQSLAGTAARLLGGSGPSATAAWVVMATVALVGGMVLARWSWRRGQPVDALAVTAVTALLVSPVSWTHHWVWALPAVALGADAARRATWPGRLAMAAVAAAFLVVPPPGWVWQHPAGSVSEALVENLYVLVALVASASAVVGMARAGRSPTWVARGARRATATRAER